MRPPPSRITSDWRMRSSRRAVPSYFFKRDENDDLANRIQEVLDVVRKDLPVAQDIHAPPTDRWSIGLEFQGPLVDELLSHKTSPDGHIYVSGTGDQALDDLNQQVNLMMMDVRPRPESHAVFAYACIDPLANADRVVDAYDKIPAVKSAGRNGFLGDSPAIEMRERDQTWYVVVREAGGDCLVGCTEEAFHFLRVTDGVVETVAESTAASEPLFVHLVDLARWDNDWPWPSPSPTPVP